jgi:hypothetical protein
LSGEQALYRLFSTWGMVKIIQQAKSITKIVRFNHGYRPKTDDKDGPMTMTSSIRKVFLDLTVQSENTRFFLLSQSTTWLALAMHLAFLCLFAYLKVPLLGLV